MNKINEAAEKDLVEAIEALTKEKTILMIAHRLKTVRNADQILVVDKGQIVQQGTHDELMKKDGIYKRFVILFGLFDEKGQKWVIKNIKFKKVLYRKL